jgi:NAD(P)-dependent dehydrogenase (short-subunit alcohol dehydrogenase family)
MNPLQFKDKVAVITGSSRGIGKAIAIALARSGASVVINGLNQTRLKEAAMELQKIHTDVLGVCCDVSTPEGGQLLINEAISRFNRIDILINNVGISMRGNISELNPIVFKTVFESNVMGSICPMIPALPHLRQTQGSIVFISSIAGIRGLPMLSAYSSSKMALRAIAESLRIEEAEYNIHVGLVYIGITEIEEGKESIGADGSKFKLQMRKGNGVQSLESVALSVVNNITRRRFISTSSLRGKFVNFAQALFPLLIEKIIIRYHKKFEDKFK